jgi:hypothetical protein
MDQLLSENEEEEYDILDDVFELSRKKSEIKEAEALK